MRATKKIGGREKDLKVEKRKTQAQEGKGTEERPQLILNLTWITMRAATLRQDKTTSWLHCSAHAGTIPPPSDQNRKQSSPQANKREILG